MKHAFVIPAYGDSPFLEECLRSLQGQRDARSAIAIATSTPTPRLEDTARRHRVPLLVNPVRAGIAGDWNFALQATDADLVTLAHHDDLYDPAYAGAIGKMFEREPDALLAFTDLKANVNTGRPGWNLNVVVKKLLCELAFRGEDVIASRRRKRALLRFGNPICCPSVTLNRRVARDFRFGHDLSSNLDWEAWANLADRQGAFLYVRRPLVAQRIHAATTTLATIESGVRRREDRIMFERFWGRTLGRAIGAVYALSYPANRSGQTRRGDP